MSSEANGTASLGALHDLLDPAFDHDGSNSSPASEKPINSKKRVLENDDEDEEVDVEESSEEEYEYESSNNNDYIPPPVNNFGTPSRRRTRSCAVPDVLKTKEVVTLDDLMKHGILRPGIKRTRKYYIFL